MSGDVVFIHMVFFPLLKWIECCCDRFLRGEKQKPQVGAAKSGSVLAVIARVLGFVRRSMCQKPSLRGVAVLLPASRHGIIWQHRETAGKRILDATVECNESYCHATGRNNQTPYRRSSPSHRRVTKRH